MRIPRAARALIDAGRARGDDTRRKAEFCTSRGSAKQLWRALGRTAPHGSWMARQLQHRAGIDHSLTINLVDLKVAIHEIPDV